jgi:hypothetical protein
MPALNFTIKVLMDNPETMPELEARVSDLSPAFAAIFDAWVKTNAQKFQQSVGAEQTGAGIFDEEWAAVTPQYYRAKHRLGSPKVTQKAARGGKARFAGAFPDWLMVRTGALREAMTNPDALFHEFDAQMAMFGLPEDPFLANLVEWQAGPRQKDRFVVFLADPDRNAIEQILQDYFSLGANFASIRQAKALAAVGYAPIDALGMEADFEEPGL